MRIALLIIWGASAIVNALAFIHTSSIGSAFLFAGSFGMFWVNIRRFEGEGKP